MKKLILTVLVTCFSVSVFAATEVRQAVLSEDIVDRNSYAPLGSQSCGNENDVIQVDSSSLSKIYLWNRVSNDKKRRLIHSWQQSVNGEWKEQANVGLRIGVSVGWRTWSSKNLDANFHKGNWRVVVSTEDDLENVLCVVSFSVN